MSLLFNHLVVSAFKIKASIRLHSVRTSTTPLYEDNSEIVHRRVSFLLASTATNSGFNCNSSSTADVKSTKASFFNTSDVPVSFHDGSINSPPWLNESVMTNEKHMTFWGSTHTKQDLQDFCYQAVFRNSSSIVNMDPTVAATAAVDKVTVLNLEPPLVIIHDFLSHAECEELILAATHQELQRSTTGATQETTDIRTSSTTWLREDGDDSSDSGRTSDKNHVLRSFAQRVSQLSGLPTENMENVQIINYIETQKFDIHTDHLDTFNDLDVRGRLATCLVYLNDGYQGGETFFPEYDVSVKATKGSALFFWNTLERPGMENYEPYMFLNVDTRLRHAGLPVINGVKWACNRWIHPINFGAGVRGLDATK